MKTRVLTLLMFFLSFYAYAQDYTPYFPEPLKSDFNANTVCQVFVDGVMFESENVIEIAFFDEEGICRCRDWIKMWSHGYMSFATYYGQENDKLSIKFYNHETGQSSDDLGVHDITGLVYHANDVLGSGSNPFRIDFVSPTTSTFTGTGNWSEEERWAPRVPYNFDNAVIAANSICVIDEDATVAYNTLTIKDGAQFFAPSNAAITATVEKYISAYTPNTKNNYYFVSSPITTELNYNTFESVGMLQGDYDLYSFEQDPDDDLEWQNFKEMEELEADFAGYFTLMHKTQLFHSMALYS